MSDAVGGVEAGQNAISVGREHGNLVDGDSSGWCVAPTMTPALPPLGIRLRRAALFVVACFAPRLLAAAGGSDLELGRQLFHNLCVTCHGFEGAGATAPSLNRPKLDYAPDEAALRTVIIDGLPARGMPRVRRWTERELRQLVAYVRSLGRLPPAPLKGNPRQGNEIFNRLGCATCHIVNGQGGTFGPDLTSIGKMRGPDYLRQSIVDPGAVLPKGSLPVPGRGFNEYLPVVAVTRAGREIKGVRLNEDALTIQVRDEGSQLHSLRKSELTRLEKLTGTSMMPNVSAQLAPAELDDLLAYLAGLQGKP